MKLLHTRWALKSEENQGRSCAMCEKIEDIEELPALTMELDATLLSIYITLRVSYFVQLRQLQKTMPRSEKHICRSARAKSESKKAAPCV
uniref:Uncharacterized protein n=1 Tax=Romanomermis culicivorax TaxID=13658 RepID=A0A915L1D5_ROMCU